MQATDIANPNYFHKVVDCQWACPAHTPVPEYIRRIAQGDHNGAYLINWKSNVFPGILGRTCDRPCEPACRRGRLEEQPVAICRLKRVAADRKQDIERLLPKAPAMRNGKRIACVGGGPASLTVARDLAAIGYEVVVFDSDSRAGGMMRSQIPKFRLPDEVIDEEVGYALSTGGAFVAGRRINSLKALLGDGYDAIFVGCGAPHGRDLDILGRKEAADNVRVGIEWLASVFFGHTHKIGRRVVVLGGGNTAMDCCRSARRLGGVDVKVVVRSGYAEMKASPWEKEDAAHEGVEILNYLVPKEFTHEGGRLTGVLFEKVRVEKDAHGRRRLAPTGEPDVHFPCDDVLIAVGQENAFPWIETDLGIAFTRGGMPTVDPVTFQSSLPNVFIGGDAAFGPKNIITAVAHGHEAATSIDAFCRDENPRIRPDPLTNLVSQKMGIHDWSYDSTITLDRRFAVPHVEREAALRNLRTEVELGFTDEQALGEAHRCLNCDVQTVFSAPACIECDACVDICPIDCISFVPNAPEDELRLSLSAPASNRDQAILVSEPVKSQRVMVKDEDLCLHCGLCAERCPTGAWDMQKFTIELAQAGEGVPIEAVNDFVIRFANVNGSGSASANLLFARSILRMGVPIAPRNIFPSNIQGLPTWYEVRVSEQGWLGARGGADILVAMNAQTFVRDVAALKSGGYLFYDSTRPRRISAIRDDIVTLGMPITEICASQYSDPRQHQLYRNIIYVGALAALLDIDLDVMETLAAERFKGKDKLIEANQRALRLGYDEAKTRFDCPLGIRVRRSDAVGDRILVEGNFAAALGAIYGGATVCAWYPITPSTSLAEAFERLCARHRNDASGRKNYAILQAEDEIAAIGIAVGAGWNGARAFTATSGPGISLMQEFFGLAYFAEIPVVVFDVQRGGPSTGMPTRTQQSDLLSCAFASHGDTKHVLIIPDGPNEAFEFAADAFDLAERLQTPVFVMLDLDIGMNAHLSAPFTWNDARTYDRGKVLSFEELEKAPNFGRYDDVDGDGIPYRTLPGGHPTRGAYFTRGTSRDRFARYTEEGLPYIDNMERLEHKFETARGLLPRPILKRAARPTRIGVLHYGSTAAPMDEAQKMLGADGIHVDALRIRAFPLPHEVLDFIDDHDQIFVVEQNRDAQMRTLISTDLGVATNRWTPILHYNGMPTSARYIRREITARLRPAAPQNLEAAE